MQGRTADSQKVLLNSNYRILNGLHLYVLLPQRNTTPNPPGMDPTQIHRRLAGKGLDNFQRRFKMTGNPRESVPFALPGFEGRFRIYELKVALSSSER